MDSPPIPGLPGCPAFVTSKPEPSEIPVLISVPHGGRNYPADLLNLMRNPDFACPRLEDRLIDLVGTAVAERTGAALLVAQAPRAMIDLNRAEDDIDWEMFAGGWNALRSKTRPGRRARAGLGLIPRRMAGLGEIWERRFDTAVIAERIESVHRPYHATLSEMLVALRERWGAAVLVDLHSMPTLPHVAGQPGAQFVIGDRFGAAAHGSLTAAAFACLAGAGRRAAHNRPYAGGHIVERHADPAKGIHAFQLEIDRACYLDRDQRELGSGFESLVENLVALTRVLALTIGELATTATRGGLAQAAE